MGAIVNRLASLQKGLQPSQHSGPTPVALCSLRMRGEPAVANSNQSALFGMFQFPSDGSPHITGPACDPCVDQQTRRVDFQIFANHFEAVALTIHSGTAPLSSSTQVAAKLLAAVDSSLPPPLHHLRGIDKRLEHALWRCSDMNLADN